jgi:hypothetical protein
MTGSRNAQRREIPIMTRSPSVFANPIVPECVESFKRRDSTLVRDGLYWKLTKFLHVRWSIGELGMPIRFRCNRCNRLLGIARRKAGSETTCPHCGATLLVPRPVDDEDERGNLDDIDELLKPIAAPAVAPAEAPTPAAAAPVVVARAASPPQPSASRPATVPTVPRPATQPAPALPKAAPPPIPRPAPLPPEERPLFERDVDAVLGIASASANGADSGKPRPQATSGMDAMSLGGEKTNLVLTPQKATALIVVVVLLLALAFTAGFLIASR